MEPTTMSDQDDCVDGMYSVSDDDEADTRSKSETDECDSISLVSTYSSTGSVECSLAKTYTPVSPAPSDNTNSTPLKNNKPFPRARLCEEDRQTILAILKNRPGEKAQGSRIFPIVIDQFLAHQDHKMHTCLNKESTSGWAFVSPFLIQDLDNSLSPKKQKLIRCDVCILTPNHAVRVLTFTSRPESEQIQRYNSHLAREVTRLLFDDSVDSLSVIHGVVDESSTESLHEKLDQMETDAKKICLPGALDMDDDIYHHASQKLLNMIQLSQKEPPQFSIKEALGNMFIVSTNTTPTSSFSYHSKDSGCCDVEEHAMLQKELVEQQTENKVLKWKIENPTLSLDTHSMELEVDGDDIEEVSVETSAKGKSSTNRKVYEYVFRSLQGPFIENVVCSKLVDVLVQRGIIPVHDVEFILSKKTINDQNRMLLNIILKKGVVPQFVEALKSSDLFSFLVDHLKERVQALLEMPFAAREALFAQSSVDFSSKDSLSDTYSYSPDNYVLYTSPAKINITDKKIQILNRIGFQLSILLNKGERGAYDATVSKLKCRFPDDPDVLFYVLQSESVRCRMFYDTDVDQSNILSQMKSLIPRLTQPTAGIISFLARQASVCAMQGDLQRGLHLLRDARCEMEKIQPCLETGMVMYTLINLLMQQYEAEPTPSGREELIRTIAETLQVHVSHSKPEVRDELNRIFYLKVAFCYLGIGVFGKCIDCPVTVDDVKAAEACFKMIRTFPGVFVNRRFMLFSLAKSVLHYHKNNITEALQCAEDSCRLAGACGFKKELEHIEQLVAKLHQECPPIDTEEELNEALKDLSMLAE